MKNNEPFVIEESDKQEFLSMIDENILDDMMEKLAGEGAVAENNFDYTYNDFELVMMVQAVDRMYQVKIADGEIIQACIYRRILDEMLIQFPEIKEMMEQNNGMTAEEAMQQMFGVGGGLQGPGPR